MHRSLARSGLVAALAFVSLATVPVAAGAQAPRPGPDMILVRHTNRTPDEVAEAARAYASKNEWVFLGASKVKNGEVTLVKVCIPSIGKTLWAVGLELSALLPCGNLSAYRKEGRTEIAMLDPRYMQVLYPHPEVEKASAAAARELTAMLDSLAR